MLVLWMHLSALCPEKTLIRKKAFSMKSILFDDIEFLLVFCKRNKAEAHSLGKENKVLAKENLKLNSINESLKQLSDSSSVADINQESAVDEYNRLKKKAVDSFAQEPDVLVKILRKIFKTKSAVFPETELDDIDLKYEPGIAEKFKFEPDDCFHGENKDKTLRFRICTKGVVELNGDKVVSKAHVQWEKANQ